MLKPLARRSAEDAALDALRHHIVSGEAGAGARLTEQGLADSLGIARATVRTALHRLASDGLVRQTPYTGWHVIALTEVDLRELYTLRAALEGLAARLLASHVSGAARQSLEEAFGDLATACAAGDAMAITECDFTLHETLVALSGHQLLARHYAQLGHRLRMVIASSNALLARPAAILEQHRLWLAAITSGDVEIAGREAEAHCLGDGEKLLAQMRPRG